MSNFQSFGAVTEGLEGSAPARFIAVTTDSFATLVAAGYLNDKAKIVKANDIIDINYADASSFPLNTGEASLYASFTIQYDPIAGNWNLIPAKSYAGTSANIAAYGVHSANYSYAGGSATMTITDSSITPNSVVVGRWQSSANPENVLTILPGNGQLTVVSSGNPGAGIFSYISILPSAALQNQGVYAAQYSNAGGSTTITISNPLITSGMIVEANFASQANSSSIDTVIAGSGTITIVCSANPGVSVIEYFAASASSALTTLGFYAATYSNAGGSTTISITDSNITASSIVVADFASQGNASLIQKVTPGSGTLTILCSANPGVSVVNYSATPGAEGALAGTYLVSSNNLSDVANSATALSNLGGLSLAGGTMTGSIVAAKGTGTVSAGAVTINKQAGVITTTSLSTAAGSTATVTLTNSQITTSSVVIVSLMGGTNTTIGVLLSATAAAGSSTITISNNNASSALNGTLLLGFNVL